MKRAMALGLTAMIAAAGAATAVDAQDRDRRGGRGGQPRIILYENPNFQGRSVSFYADASNLSDQSFNDRARSARITGSWRLCEDKNYRSRCEPFADDVADLGAYDFGARVSSLQQVGGRPDQAGGPDWGSPGFPQAGQGVGRDGVQGRSVVFFRRPTLNGMDVAAHGRVSADAFCQEAGFGQAVYFDENERARRAIDPEGQVVENTRALRDVLCRR
jgi:hypothetical protein